MSSIISSFEKFKDAAGKGFEEDEVRVSALQHYFSKGGVIKISSAGSPWPSLAYPSVFSLKNKMDFISKNRTLLLRKQSSWKQKLREASIYHFTNNVKKFKEKAYWQHLAKYASDAEYRADADSIKLPVHLLADKRWKPMIEMFVQDYDYRKKLAETVARSIVYKNDKRVARFADVIQSFRVSESSKKIEELQKKIDAMDRDLEAMKELMKWAKS